MAIQERGKAVHGANLGLYLDRPPLLVPERGLVNGRNFRVQDGETTNYNVGWTPYESLNLDNKPVTLIDEFFASGGTRKLILGNTTDLFQYNGVTLAYITPKYSTGTASCSGGTTVTGTGTAFQTNLKAGDFINFDGAAITDPAATWYEIDSITNETSLELTAAGPTTGGSVAYTARLTFTGTMLDPFLPETFKNGASLTEGSDGDRWYATNGIDAIVAWDGSTDDVYYPDMDSIQTAQALRRFKNTLVAVAPTVGGALLGQTIMTSAIGQPENFATLEASQFVIYDGSDTLVNAVPIGELLAIYSERAIIMAQYVGSPLYFAFRTAVSGYGARSARGIVRFPGRHEFFSTDGMYEFDGVTARQTHTHIWKDVTRRSSPGRTKLVQGRINEGDAEMIWVVPLNTDADAEAGTPEHAYVGHYLEDTGDYPMAHSYRQFPATAIGTYTQSTTLTFDQITDDFDEVAFRWDDQQLQSAFPQVLFGTAGGDIFAINAQQQSGTVPTSFVRFSRRPLVDSRRNGVVKRIYPNVNFTDSSTGQLQIALRLFDSPNAASVKQTANATISLDGSSRFAAFRNSGRFCEVDFGSGPSADGIWHIEGYDMDTIPGGSR